MCGLITELSSLKYVNASSLVYTIYSFSFYCPFFLLLPLPRVELLTCNTIGQFHPLHTHICALIG